MKYFFLFVFLYLPCSLVNASQSIANNGNAKEWHLTIARAVKPYFTQPYQDTKYFTYKIIDDIYSNPEDDQKYVTSRYIKDINYKVYRPNHGFGHGMRQAYSMGDIISAFQQNYHKNVQFNNPHAVQFMTWVNNHFNEDPNFIKKVELLSAFQRTGRQSEINEGSHEKVYAGYKKKDSQNFYNFAKNNVGEGKLFINNSELATYQRALWAEPQTQDEYYLERLLRLSHTLDLKRVLGYRAQPMLDTISRILCLNEPMTEKEEAFLEALWQRSSEYLEVTGETDLDNPNRQTYTDDFYLMANDTNALVDALESVKLKPFYISKE